MFGRRNITPDRLLYGICGLRKGFRYCRNLDTHKRIKMYRSHIDKVNISKTNFISNMEDVRPIKIGTTELEVATGYIHRAKIVTPKKLRRSQKLIDENS